MEQPLAIVWVRFEKRLHFLLRDVPRIDVFPGRREAHWQHGLLGIFEVCRDGPLEQAEEPQEVARLGRRTEPGVKLLQLGAGCTGTLVPLVLVQPLEDFADLEQLRHGLSFANAEV
jgi:hypothetical protein